MLSRERHRWRFVSRFGFNAKNVVAPLALLPIAFYIKKKDNRSFDISSKAEDVEAQIAIRKWLIFATLKNAFGGSSDTVLNRLRELLISCNPSSPFPAEELFNSLGIEPRFNEAEIQQILGYSYKGWYTYLVLSLLYPDRDWKDAVFHEDHIFPESEFQIRLLKKRGYDDARVHSYISKYNRLANLQLLTESENLSKKTSPFDQWIKTRDEGFRKRHLIPEMDYFGFDSFEEFFKKRENLIVEALKKLQ